MANYYIRHDCPDCRELHGIYDYIEYPEAGLSGCRLSEIYSQKQLALFREFTVHYRPEVVVAIMLIGRFWPATFLEHSK